MFLADMTERKHWASLFVYQSQISWNYTVWWQRNASHVCEQ